MIELKNISKTYQPGTKNIKALEDINLEVNKNEFVVIQGPSGCGKTTLLLTIAGMLKPDTGTAMVIGQDVYALSHNQRADMRAQHIGFVFQQFHLIDYLTVRENILLPSINKHSLDTQELCLKLVKEFDIHDRLEHFPAELSTGQRQRVALARSLINQPQIILADEPIGNLDQANSIIILEQLRAFAQSDGTVLMVTHNNQAAEIADRIVLIQKGIIQ